ncbi:MAG: hypothetical protein AAFZ65_11125 [Planctomycetota bacterium]
MSAADFDPPQSLPPALAHSLCAGCDHGRQVRSARGSVFLNCGRAKVDPRFDKYPPQPVVHCTGYEPASGPQE